MPMVGDEDVLMAVPKNRVCVASSPRFIVRCKTLEFASRLTLPNRVMSILGKKKRDILVECGHSGTRFKCAYHVRRIRSSGNLMVRLRGGWKSASKVLMVQQGDTLVFDQCSQVPFKFHVSVMKHTDAIKVEPEPWT